MKVIKICPGSGQVCQTSLMCDKVCGVTLRGQPFLVVPKSEVDQVVADRDDALRRLEAWGQKAGSDRALRVQDLAMRYAGELLPDVRTFALSLPGEVDAIVATTRDAAYRMAEAMVPPLPIEESATVADGVHNPASSMPEHDRDDANPEPAGRADPVRQRGG